MEAIGTLRILIEELPPADRTLIQLKYHEELSYGNIGDQMELGAGNVGYKHNNLLKHLSQALQRRGSHRAEAETPKTQNSAPPSFPNPSSHFQSPLPNPNFQ